MVSYSLLREEGKGGEGDRRGEEKGIEGRGGGVYRGEEERGGEGREGKRGELRGGEG